MARHRRKVPCEDQPDHDRVIQYLARLVDAERCERIVGWVRTEEEVRADVEDIVDDAWRTVERNED